MVVLDEIKGSSISKKPNSTMSVMLCTGAIFVKKVARIVPFDTVDLHLLTLRILEPTHPEILHLISITLSKLMALL